MLSPERGQEYGSQSEFLKNELSEVGMARHVHGTRDASSYVFLEARTMFCRHFEAAALEFIGSVLQDFLTLHVLQRAF